MSVGSWSGRVTSAGPPPSGVSHGATTVREARPPARAVASRSSGSPARSPLGNLPRRGAVRIVARARRRRRAPPRRHRARRRRLDVARRRPRATGARARRAGQERRADPATAGASSSRPPSAGRRRWITFDGIFYQADVWLDGAYLGDPEGYFFPHSFDVTALSRLGDDHVLAVEVTCDPERGTTGRRNITGLFQHSEAVARDWNPGGIWRPVLVYDTGPVKLDRLRVLCRDADETRAHLRLHARLDSDVARTVRVRTSADGAVVAETEHPLAAGVNEIDWSLDVDRPRLWWPRALGDQPLTEIDVDVLVDGELQRPAVPPHRPARGGVERLGLLDQRRAAVPEGRQRAADAAGSRRRLARRRPARRRARRRGRARRPARAGPHRRPRAVPRRRRARDAPAAGLPAAVGLRPPDPQGGRAPGPRGRRLARPPPVDRAVVRPRRADRRGPAGRDRPPRQAPAAVRRPAAADVEQVGARPLGQAVVRAGRPDPPDGRPRRRRARTSPSSTAPTRTCGSAGTAATSPSSPSSPGCSPASCASSASSAPSRCPTGPPSSSTPRAGRSSTGRRCASTTGSRSR